MNKIKLRTKIEIIFVVLLLVGIYITSVLSVTRTITSLGDDVVTFIRNSNGKYWTVSDTNLELALEDIGTDGHIWVGSDYTAASTVNLSGHDNVILDFEGHTVTMNADVPFCNFSGVQETTVRDVTIIPSTTHTTDIFRLHCGQWGWQSAWEKRVYHCSIENVYILGADVDEHNWTGIHFWMNNLSSMQNVDIRDVYMFAAGTGIKIEIDGTGLSQDEKDNAYMNLCTVENVYINRCVNGIWFEDAGADRVDRSESGGINTWYFENIEIQATDSYSEDPVMYGIRNVTGGGNRFNHLIVYDWQVVVNKGNSIWIGADSWDTTMDLAQDWNTQDHYCLDEGYETVIESRSGNPYNVLPYQYIVFRNSTHVFAKEGNSGLIARSGTANFVSTDAQWVIDHVCDKANVSSVFIAPGTYNCDGTVSTSDMHELTIEGGDRFSSILGVDSIQLDGGIISISDASNSNITLRNLCFDGSGATDSSVGLYICFADDVSNVLIDSCVFQHWNAGVESKGIFVSPDSNDIASRIKIINTDFIDCDYGIYFEGDSDPSVIQYSDISHNYYKDCITSIMLSYTSYSSISNNIIDGGTTGIVVLDSHNCTFTANIGNDLTLGIDEQGATENCSYGFNNFIGCISGYDINSVNYKPTGQVNFTNFNFGSWT